jgi:hypothetical protein
VGVGGTGTAVSVGRIGVSVAGIGTTTSTGDGPSPLSAGVSVGKADIVVATIRAVVAVGIEVDLADELQAANTSSITIGDR